ncbi:peptidyl-prolyl cis-trans isomerase [Gemmatimonadetes bacterium T265]|nr:peptidyl-prolyl cis-trans isomerase [Gemmatimonadetes bacterium T265]
MRPSARRPLLVAALLSAACRPGADAARDSARAVAPPVALKPANPDPATNTYAPALGVTLAKMNKRPSGLYVHDDTLGKGAAATNGQSVLVDYAGYLPDGTVFDSNRDRGRPFAFTLGQDEVIVGWDEGIQGMRVGGARTLVVPPALGYGGASQPGIPANSVLVFRVKLVGFGLR